MNIDVQIQTIYEESKAFGVPFEQYARGYIQAEEMGFKDQ
ncbi:hypothetical protein ADP71_31500 [Vitreoscilla sp. C1]|nr:hypothetical protein ADP71_31500 [Vitreoscilla sp. C1]